jgi:acyl carrier protein
MDEIEQCIRDILHQRLGVDPAIVHADSALNDHGDSLDFVDVIGDVEAAFGLRISNERIATIRTFGDLSSAIHELRHVAA